MEKYHSNDAMSHGENCGKKWIVAFFPGLLGIAHVFYLLEQTEWKQYNLAYFGGK